MVKIEYIWHDCFFVETPAAGIVFDFWLDRDGENRDFPDFLADFDPGKALYVFISHGHKDHYNPAVFSWASRFPNIRYMVSRDVMRRIRHIMSESSVYSGPKVDPSCVTALGPGDRFGDGNLTVAAFPSTDIGNSYIIELSGKRFFHAGDLNAWIWKEESTQSEVKKAIGDYNACLRDIRAYLDRATEGEGSVSGCLTDIIDYCFFPVDSRIGSEYFTGAYIFVRKFDVRRFFPMHFALGTPDERERYRTDALRFGLYANPGRGEYIPLALSGAVYMDASSSCGSAKC